MNEFITHLTDVFEHFGPIHAKRMFGGYGVYHQGLMFALVADVAKVWAVRAYEAALRSRKPVTKSGKKK